MRHWISPRIRESLQKTHIMLGNTGKCLFRIGSFAIFGRILGTLPIFGGLIFNHPARPLDPKSGKMAHHDPIDNSNNEHQRHPKTLLYSRTPERSMARAESTSGCGGTEEASVSIRVNERGSSSERACGSSPPRRCGWSSSPHPSSQNRCPRPSPRGTR